MTNSINELCISYASVILHELAHLFVALKFRIKINGFVIMPFGVYIRLNDRIISDPKTECIICVAGPVFNLLVLVICAAYILLSPSASTARMTFFMCSNAALFMINTLPIIPLDGGRILRSLLVHRYGFITASRICNVVSSLNIILVGIFSVYVLYITKFNVSAMLLCAFLIFNMSEERKNDAYTIMRQIIFSKEKLARRDMMEIRQIATKADTDPKKLLKSFSYNRYYIVSITDSEGNILSSVSESNIIDALVCGKVNKNLKHFI